MGWSHGLPASAPLLYFSMLVCREYDFTLNFTCKRKRLAHWACSFSAECKIIRMNKLVMRRDCDGNAVVALCRKETKINVKRAKKYMCRIQAVLRSMAFCMKYLTSSLSSSSSSSFVSFQRDHKWFVHIFKCHANYFISELISSGYSASASFYPGLSLFDSFRRRIYSNNNSATKIWDCVPRI